MTDRLKPLMPSLMVAILMGAVGTVALVRRPWNLTAMRPNAGSLLDSLLQTSGQNSSEPDRVAPSPPPHPVWASPLQRGCPNLDQALQQRLHKLDRTLQRSAKVLRIDPSNYGQRYIRDAYGNPVDPTPRVIVLHETVYGLSSALNTFMTAHRQDDDQVSYHSLVGLDGTLVRVVDPRLRAFGAGNSSFNGRWVVTNPKVGGSINNFSLHLSLETPEDGENETGDHSGYTSSQYDTMAVELANWMRTYGIPASSITTHRHVDLGGERADPRSFRWSELASRLRALGLLCSN